MDSRNKTKQSIGLRKIEKERCSGEDTTHFIASSHGHARPETGSSRIQRRAAESAEMWKCGSGDEIVGIIIIIVHNIHVMS
jgi:hypothetical protein